MVQIFLNGKMEYVKANTSLKAYLETKKDILPKVFVVELNMKIINKDNYAINYLKTGDRIEVVQFCGGG